MRYGLILIILTLFVSFTTNVSAQMTQTAPLSLEEAKTILAAAEARANQDNWTVAIAIVDAGGHLLAFSRIDGTQIGSIEYAIQKAKTSVYFKRPTKAFQNGLEAGNLALLTLPNSSGHEGGVPIEHNGEVIGAIGVSGVTAQQDGIIGQAGVDALPR